MPARTTCLYDFRPVVRFALDTQVRILEAGKAGSFIFIPKGMYQERGNAAVIKNFRLESLTLKEAKSRALDLCSKILLTQLAGNIKKAEVLHLQAFFHCKDA